MNDKNAIFMASKRLVELQNDFSGSNNPVSYPAVGTIVRIIGKIRLAMFPGFFEEAEEACLQDARTQLLLSEIHKELSEEINAALQRQEGAEETAQYSDEVATELLDRLPDILQMLYKDAQAGFEGDPAARNVEEIILTYPGFFAVFVYRIAHFLFSKNVPLIPRMMSGYAHSVTGIDIHPGADIGEYFFIDHGTGVVIGETASIGNHVKLYQGVTLGALSTKKDQGLRNAKRHPSIGDNVTIYSGASILGGDTVIGEGAVIGGNAFIINSIPAKTVVKMYTPELQYKNENEVKPGEPDRPDSWFYMI